METETRTNILLVDDRQENLFALQELLADLGETLLVARSGQEALRQLLGHVVAVILLDVQMPIMSGFETAALIRSRAKWSDTPIIFLTADNTDDTRTFEGYRLGAVDFMHKPIVSEVLRAKVKVFVELAKKTELVRRNTERLQAEIVMRKELELELKRSEASFRALIQHAPDGILVQHNEQISFVNPALATSLGFSDASELVGSSITVLMDPEDVPAFMAMRSRAAAGTVSEPLTELRLRRHDRQVVTLEVAAMATLFDGQSAVLMMMRDVTERKQMQARLLELAHTDHLTGLLVRRAGEEAIVRELAHAVRYKTPLAFVLLDLDHFKRINDTFGHAAGDATLQAVGHAVTRSLRACDIAVRWGGEELLAVLPHTAEVGARVLAERIRAQVEALEFPGDLRVTLSAGVAELGPDGSVEATIARADDRMYQAKAQGRNRVS